MAAASQPDEAIGYLSLLRRFVAEMENPPNRDATLRGLIAPELAPARFDALLQQATEREQHCRATASTAPARS